MFWTGFFTSPEYRSVNRAVSKVEGLKLKITAHKTFKNKFDQIRSGLKFIYRQNTSVIGVHSNRQTRTFHRQLEHVLFFAPQCNANVFQSRKLTNVIILFWREIHSFVSINIASKHPRALICVYNRIGRTHFGNYQKRAERLLARLVALLCNLFFKRSVKRQAH